MKTIIVIVLILVSIGGIVRYSDVLHDPVESIEELKGRNYDYAHKSYYGTDPDNSYKININRILNEFDGAIDTVGLIDSTVHVFTWNYLNHKETIWVGHTKKMRHKIIDAIRYSNDVQF